MTYIYILLGWLGFVAFYQDVKPLPPGVNIAGEIQLVADSNMVFLHDLTSLDSAGERHYEQEIFDSLFACIRSAQKYILLDMFLFNSYKGPSAWSMNELSADLSHLLIEKKQLNPSIQIDFITDPVNTLYGGTRHHELEAMREAGINIIITDLSKMRDSNPAYSPVWRTFIQWFGNTSKYGLLPNAFSSELPRTTLRSYLSFLNLKANHRKVFIADNGEKMISIITSANPHSASADFSNIGIMVEGEIWQDIYDAEFGVAQFSGSQLFEVATLPVDTINHNNQYPNSIQLITEGEILTAILRNMENSSQGDSIKMAMFYLSNRKIVRALLDASDRGVDVRLILDPNKDGFGFHHNGTPNRPVVKELIKKSKGQIQVRWYHTRGEQFHSKLTFFKKQTGNHIVIMGSANMTRKNLENYNLETNVLLSLDPTSSVGREIDNYFEKLWWNRGYDYTVDRNVFDDSSFLKTILYRFQEFSGLSTY